MKAILLSVLLTSALLVSLHLEGAPNSAKTIRLTWDLNTETDLAGYIAYWGIVGSGTTNAAGTPTNTITLGNLTNGSWWFAVTARTANNLESGFSNIVLASVPRNPSNLSTIP